MDIDGPRCARLLTSAFDGPTARHVRFARFAFTVRQAFVGKARDEVVIETRRRRFITCHRLPLAVRLRYRFAIDRDGRVASLDVGDIEIQGALESWLARVGGLVEVAGYRSVEQSTRFWPSERALDLLDLGGWRGEAAFLTANLMLIAVRRHVAVRPVEPATAATGDQPAPKSSRRPPPSYRRLSGRPAYGRPGGGLGEPCPGRTASPLPLSRKPDRLLYTGQARPPSTVAVRQATVPRPSGAHSSPAQATGSFTPARWADRQLFPCYASARPWRGSWIAL